VSRGFAQNVLRRRIDAVLNTEIIVFSCVSAHLQGVCVQRSLPVKHLRSDRRSHHNNLNSIYYLYLRSAESRRQYLEDYPIHSRSAEPYRLSVSKTSTKPSSSLCVLAAGTTHHDAVVRTLAAPVFYPICASILFDQRECRPTAPASLTTWH
jgi:hypothetical protein